jgi:hypothetical protein
MSLKMMQTLDYSGLLVSLQPIIGSVKKISVFFAEVIVWLAKYS